MCTICDVNEFEAQRLEHLARIQKLAESLPADAFISHESAAVVYGFPLYRLPAAVNGVTGIRPTIGRVSNHNIVPLAWSMDTAGPMARTVADCATIFQVIAGHDPNDEASARTPVPSYLAQLERGVRDIRIGIVPDYYFSHLQAPVHDAVRAAVQALRGLAPVWSRRRSPTSTATSPPSSR